MGRKCVEVKSLYGVSIDDLNVIANSSDSNYTRDVVKAVIMRHKGVHTQVIADTLSKCNATIVSYINSWNNNGIACIADFRGGNIESTVTDEMVEDILDVVTNKSPHDFGYEQNRWNAKLLTRYVEDKYGKQYSDTWIRKILTDLGFTYKRGAYKPTKGDPKLQESFKKNVNCVGYN